jgi:16S rRNA (guanine(966)-N(2))-methyltransferase RsmD
MLRIVSGKYRGRKLQTSGSKGTRPTLEKTRDILFNVIQSRYHLNEFVAIDLFAGSGALGFEAISRGVTETIFTENNKREFLSLMKNISSLSLEKQCEARRVDAIQWLKARRWELGARLFLLDPPYNSHLVDDVLDILEDRSDQLIGNLIVIETLKETSFHYPDHFYLFQRKEVGQTKLEFLEITPRGRK